MSRISLDVVRADLRMTHASDDALLQQLLDGAEDEACQFMDVTELPGPASADSPPLTADSPPQAPVAPAVVNAVLLLVQAGYLPLTGAEQLLRRQRAEQLLWPFRAQLGV